MTSRADQFFSLLPAQRKTVHILLCEHALDVWKTYVEGSGSIRYIETVCGTEQTIDPELPSLALTSVLRGFDVANLQKRYHEPMVALQDADLEFPEPIRLAYYSLYNLFRKYVVLEAIDDWLLVNQALSSETDSSKWETMLVAAMDQAK